MKMTFTPGVTLPSLTLALQTAKKFEGTHILEVCGKPVFGSRDTLFIVAPLDMRVRMKGGYRLFHNSVKIISHEAVTRAYVGTIVPGTESGKVDTTKILGLMLQIIPPLKLT